MWDSVPWFIGGGAQHSPEVARLLAFAATSGAEGIVSPGDLKVVPLATPGTSIRVLAGAGLALNKAAGGTQQTYVFRNPSEDVKAIAATGSGSGRSDLVIAQVKDPFMPGENWATPSDVTTGPYIFTSVIPNVSPTTTTVPPGTSGIPLARIDIPSNTATITAGMVKDLRKLAQPRTWTDATVIQGPDPLQALPLSQTTFTQWPSITFATSVPTWATEALVRVNFSGILIGATANADIRVTMGGLTGPTTFFDQNITGAGGAETVPHFAYAKFDVTTLRGQTVPIGTSARRVFVSEAPGNLLVDAGMQLSYDVTYRETVV